MIIIPLGGNGKGKGASHKTKSRHNFWVFLICMFLFLIFLILIFFFLPPAMRFPLAGWLRSTPFVIRCVSWLHSYPGVWGSSGRIRHPGSHGGIIRLGIITRTWVSGGISATALITVASVRVGIRRRMHVSSRHDRLG